MYLAPPTTTNNDRLIAGAITAFLLAGILATLHITSLPEVRDKTDNYEEINWTRFTPKPKPEKIVETPKPRPVKVEEPVEFEPPPDVAPAPRPAQKIDLSALKNQFEPATRPTKTLSTSRSDAKPAESASTAPKIDLQKSTVLAGLNTLTGDSPQKLQITGRGSKGRAGMGTPSLKAGRSSSLEIGKGPNFNGGSPALGAPKEKSANAGAPAIAMVDLGQMGGNFADLSPIYRELIEWMKRHPSDFPDVVDRFMEKAPGDLTSLVSFQVQGRTFNLYILCKEKLFEVRVCLLEGDESTYLIDRGFKENSSFLRVGSVNRTGTGEILSFGTTRQSASDSRTTEFYQIFLSWWENARAGN